MKLVVLALEMSNCGRKQKSGVEGKQICWQSQQNNRLKDIQQAFYKIMEIENKHFINVTHNIDPFS